MKLLMPLAAAAGAALFSHAVLAAPLFDARNLAKTQPSGQAVSPAFSWPSTGAVSTYGGYVFHITGLRVAGLTEFVRVIPTQVRSAPNATGQRTLTQTCAYEFRHPITGVVAYTTPTQSIVSPPYDAMRFADGGCNASPMKQAANPLGLLVELAGTITQTPMVPGLMETRAKLRVTNPATRVARWSALITPTVALGTPQYAEVVDTNNDGTDEIVVQYIKDVTPLGFPGFKYQLTNAVRNGLTGAPLGQHSWVETYTY